MTKKDFILMAESFKKLKRIQDKRNWQYGVAFCMYGFSQLNDRFSPSIFMSACECDEDDNEQIIAMYNLLRSA